MQHRFHFTASRFDRARVAEAAAWLRASLIDAAEEAELAEPSMQNESCTFVYDIGGDRFDITIACVGSEWVVTVEHEEPQFIRRPEAHTRHEARFDALIVAIRAIILGEPTAKIRAETGD